MTQENEQRIRKLESEVEELKKQIRDLNQKTNMDHIFKEVEKRLLQQMRAHDY